MSKRNGKIIIISGPSGSGKNTIIDRLLLEEELDIRRGTTHTTRLQREGEKHGRERFFVSQEEFQELVDSGEILEFNFYNGNYYGTPRSEVMKAIDEKKNVVFEIDVNGALKVKECFPETVLIFITCQSDMLEARLRGRKIHSEEDIQERLAIYKKELECARHYDLVVENHDGKLEDAVAVIKGYINNT